MLSTYVNDINFELNARQSGKQTAEEVTEKKMEIMVEKKNLEQVWGWKSK